MSTTQRVVRKQLAGAEDILQGVGTVTQTRGSGSYPIHKLDIPIPTYSLAEMQASSAEFMRLYGTDTAYTDYRRNPEGTVGIPSNLGGVWEPIRSSEYLVCGNFASGAYVFSSDCIVALDQQSYNWQGTIPKVVAAGAIPTTSGGIGAGAWVDRTDVTLRGEITPSVTEALRRSYAEAGYNVVGTFEAGFTFVNVNDVGIHEATGKGYTGPAGDVAAGTDPTSGGFVDRSGETLRGQLSSVTLQSLGVAGNCTNVLNELVAAFNYANTNGLGLTGRKGQVIKIVGSADLTLKTSIDWGGATLDVTDYTGTIHLDRPTPKAEYLPGSYVVSALQTQTTLTGQYFSGWANTPEVDDAYVIIETDIPYYNYNGTVYNRVEMLHSTRYGVMSDSLKYSLDTSRITKVIVYKNEPTFTFFKNLRLKVGNQTQHNLIVPSHSRLIMQDILIDESNVELTSNPVWIEPVDSFDIQLINIKAKWANNSAVTGSYIFAAWRSMNVTLTNCGGEGTGWGAVGTSLCKNMKYIDCRLSRIDSHHPFVGRLDVVRGVVGSWGITASAIGDLYIDGTCFEIDNLPKQSDQPAVIKSRQDVGGLFDGDIYLNNVNVKNQSAGLQFLFAQLNSIGGVPAGSPITYRFGQNIFVDGIKVESQTLFNLCPKLQQNSGCQFPSRVSIKDVTGGSNIFWEQAFAGLTPSAETVTSQVVNMPMRGKPNTFITLDDVTLAKEGVSLSEGTDTQKFMFHIDFRNLHGVIAGISPNIELMVGGNANLDVSVVEGIDFFLGGFTNKPLQVSVTSGAIMHTGQFNTNLVNGLNGFVKLKLDKVGVYGQNQTSLASSLGASITNCDFYTSTGAATVELVSDMNGAAGTYPLLNATASLNNRYAITVGSGSDIQLYPFILPAAGRAVYIQVSPASGITITRSADGGAITTAFTGTPYPRTIILI